MNNERRASARLPIEQAVSYWTLQGDAKSRIESGQTINISSSGILFTSEGQLPPGTKVEVDVSWPVLLNGTCPLKLTIRGEVVRSDVKSTAIRILRHEFRTRKIVRAQTA